MRVKQTKNTHHMEKNIQNSQFDSKCKKISQHDESMLNLKFITQFEPEASKDVMRVCIHKVNATLLSTS